MFNSKIVENGNIQFSGYLDASQAEKADEVLDQIKSSCTLDFRNLDYISSAGLGILLAHQKRLKESGQALRLANLNKHVKDIFILIGFDQVFDII